MYSIFNAIICGAAFLLAFIIFINQNKINIRANRWFGSFIACIFLILLQNVIVDCKILGEDDILNQLINISSFVVAPVFYLSVCYYIEPVRKWKAIDCLHFSFAFLIFILLVCSWLIDNKSEPEDISPEIVQKTIAIFNFIFSLYVFIYCFLAYRKIAKHQKTIKLLNSTSENLDLKWLKNIIVGVIFITFFWILDIVFQISEGNKTFDTLTSLIYFLSILYITYYWQKQKEIFPYSLKEKEEIETIIVENTLPEGRRKQLLTHDELQEQKNRLLQLMELEKPFLDFDLSLVKLAGSMKISTHILSYVINNGFDENFYQFINRYRIEEAKKLMADAETDRLSLLGIGFAVGFNSKTVFNTTFKKVTGQTPSEYKKQIGSTL
ncbi:helix-turn-helix domain-containing protein [Flavobacterium sp. TR2]|uniref:helix-turn-helix domain-containing protein n=1 Tax=Flavobacterium sp. TR2 TaxID=2977321 RepID=UPI0021B12C66|nr:helix-turn-helix domain-containing protein [Flavobacterium sp. TR2]UWY28269.1 helix-turn-helix domain-containing protein [Flavobacterium sp. TR2]